MINFSVSSITQKAHNSIVVFNSIDLPHMQFEAKLLRGLLQDSCNLCLFSVLMDEAVHDLLRNSLKVRPVILNVVDLSKP